LREIARVKRISPIVEENTFGKAVILLDKYLLIEEEIPLQLIKYVRIAIKNIKLLKQTLSLF